MIFLSTACAIAPLNADDAPRPTAHQKPAANPDLDTIRRLFSQLTDADSDVRENARRDLMGLKRQDLPKIHRVLAEHLPLAPAESDVLHDIVQQIYLADFSYPTEGSQGFLGISFGYGGRFTTPPCGGVEILYRMPGFCAYRYFDDGDVILAIGEGPNEVEPRNPDEMTQLIVAHPPGQKVTFKVLRRGRVEHVTVALDARPMAADPLGGGNINELMAQRRIESEAYWEENFETLVETAAVR